MPADIYTCGPDEEYAAALAEHVGCDVATAEDLIAAARPLWEVLDRLGWTDAHGGMEFRRVFAAAVPFITAEANPPLLAPTTIGG